MKKSNILKFKGEQKFIEEIENNKKGITNLIKKIYELVKVENSFNAIENLQKYILKLEQRNIEIEKNIEYIWK